MWPKEYKDYPPDKPLTHQQVRANKGIIGCEMHDLNGWGNSLHDHSKKRKKGLLRRLLAKLFGEK